MPRYRIVDGRTLQHGDLVVHAGSVIELPAHVAGDLAVKPLLVEIDAPAVEPETPLPTRPYRIRQGHALAHQGAVQPEGTVVELVDHVAADLAVAPHIEPLPPAPAPPPSLEQTPQSAPAEEE